MSSIQALVEHWFEVPHFLYSAEGSSILGSTLSSYFGFEIFVYMGWHPLLPHSEFDVLTDFLDYHTCAGLCICVALPEIKVLVLSHISF